MIGIIGAMTVEIQGLADKLTDKKVVDIKNYKFIQGSLNGKEVVLSICGIGKVFASTTASIMITHFDVDLVINIGVAGGSKATHQCDIVLGDKMVQHDYDATLDASVNLKKGQLHGFDSQFFNGDEDSIKALAKVIEDLGYPYHIGHIATGDMFIASDEKSNQLVSDFDACAFDMESAAIAQVCTVTGTKFVSMRAISDNGDHNANLSFATFLEQAASRAIEIVTKFISIR